MIGDKIFDRMVVLCKDLVEFNKERMQQAYERQDDGKLGVTITFSIYPDANMTGKMDIDATISYVIERVKEKITARVAYNMDELPFDEVPKRGAK